MKYKVIVEYEYPVEHKTPVKAELTLHGDRVETWDIKPLEQEPTTKNDLGVDCISREQAKSAIRDKFKDLPSRVEINTILNELPSVTPQEPILDKIRAEIEQDAFKDVNGSKYIFVNRVNQILDKYKAESEDKE